MHAKHMGLVPRMEYLCVVVTRCVFVVHSLLFDWLTPKCDCIVVMFSAM